MFSVHPSQLYLLRMIIHCTDFRMRCRCEAAKQKTANGRKKTHANFLFFSTAAKVPLQQRSTVSSIVYVYALHTNQNALYTMSTENRSKTLQRAVFRIFQNHCVSNSIEMNGNKQRLKLPWNLFHLPSQKEKKNTSLRQ